MKLTPIKDIKPNPNNPRVIKDEKFAKLVQSLKELPEMATVRPVVVNSDMIVLGGNVLRQRRQHKRLWLHQLPAMGRQGCTRLEQEQAARIR